VPGEDGQIVGVDPIRRNHHSGLQRQEIASARVANRYADIDFDRQLCDSTLDAEAGSLTWARLRSNESIDWSRRLLLRVQLLSCRC
jgi:hypothetical protein